MPLLFMTGYCLAADSYSIRVACTIPAYPGLNAPAIVEQKTVEKKDENKTQKENNADTIRQEEQKQLYPSAGVTVIMKLQTVYVR